MSSTSPRLPKSPISKEIENPMVEDHYLLSSSLLKPINVRAEEPETIEFDVSEVTVYDVEEIRNIPIFDYLENYPDNIVLIIDTENGVGITRDYLKRLMNNVTANLRYACRTNDHDVVSGPYLYGRTIGIYGLLSYSKMKWILFHPEIQVIKLREIDYTNSMRHLISSSLTPKLSCNIPGQNQIYDLDTVLIHTTGKGYKTRRRSLRKKTNKNRRKYKSKKSRKY